MSTFIRSVLLISLTAISGYAVAVPKADDAPSRNLEHYLEYRTDSQLNLVCKEKGGAFICTSTDQKIVSRDGNATTEMAFEKGQLHFNGAVGTVLQKGTFDATMREVEQTEQLRRQFLASKNPYFAPPSSPLQDRLDRTLFGNLEQVHVNGLSIHSHQPETKIAVDSIAYVNAMKRTASGVAFTDRILGEIGLEYTGATVETDDPSGLYTSLPMMLETWFETNNTVRADYVGAQLGRLYADQLRSPFSGILHLKTNYLGNDVIGITIEARNRNKKGENDTFAFRGELHNASSLFTPARMPSPPATPDFLFQSMQSKNQSDGSGYRALLKTDKRFSGYIREYDALLRAAFDKRLQTYSYSPVLSQWLTQAKQAFSDLMLGKADTLNISVTNRSGMTVMQVFGMLMGRLMMPPASAQQTPDQEKIIMDTAASNLDVHIEAK